MTRLLLALLALQGQRWPECSQLTRNRELRSMSREEWKQTFNELHSLSGRFNQKGVVFCADDGEQSITTSAKPFSGIEPGDFHKRP